MEDEFGMAQSAFGAEAQKSATGAAEKAFGPSAPTASSPVNTNPAPSEQAQKNPLADIPNMSEALKGTYDNLRAAAQATARRFLRFGTDTAPKNAPALGQIAGGMRQDRARTAQDAPQENVAATPAIQTQAPQKAVFEPPAVGGVFSQQTGIKMGRGAFGGGEVPSFEHNGVNLELPGDIDLNDDNAVRAAVEGARAFADEMNAAYAAEEEDW